MTFGQFPSTNPISSPFLYLPEMHNENEKNWLALKRWADTQSPYATAFNPSGTIPTIPSGAPGNPVYVQWTPTPNQDTWGFLGQSDPTWIRFPYDGLYDIYYNMGFSDTVTGNTELRTWVDYANASTTGYGAPNFGGGQTTGVMADSSGNARNGTYVNATAGWPFTVPGIAVPDDGAQAFGSSNASTEDAYATIPYTTGLLNPNGDFSLECWARFDNATPSGPSDILHLREHNGHNFLFQIQSGPGFGYVKFGSGDGGSTQGGNLQSSVGTLPTDANPHHIVVTQGSGTLTCYVDGSAVSLFSSTAYIPFVFSTPVQTQMELAGADGFPASIAQYDELAFYNTALSGARVAAHFAATASLSTYSAAVLADTPSGYYHLDENTPNGTANSIRAFYPTNSIFKHLSAHFKNFPGKAGDLIRAGYQVNSAQSIASPSLLMASFCLASPIPHRQTD